jgi:hypothetical protein
MSDGRRRRATSVDEMAARPDAAVRVHPVDDLANVAPRSRDRYVDATGECASEPADGEQDIGSLIEARFANEFE